MLSVWRRRLATAAASAPTKATNSKLQDVTIIGGGPAGLSLLAALKTSPVTKHLECTLVEGFSLQNVRDFAVDPPQQYTNRVVSLTPKSVEFMNDKIGSWQYMDHDRVKFYNNIVAYDGQDNSARIEFDSFDINEDFLAVMAENVNIQSSLLQAIEALPKTDQPVILDNVKVTSIDTEMDRNAQIDIEHATLQLPPASSDHLSPGADWPVVHLSNGESIKTRLLVGADGYNSPVRHFAGITSRGWQYNRFGVVATMKAQDDDYRAVGWQRFLTTGPLAILPLSEENRTIVWSSTPELLDILVKCDPQIFPELVNAAMVLDEVDLKYIYGKLKANPSDTSVLEEIQWRMSKQDQQDLMENYPVPLVEVIENSRAKFPLKMSHADTYTGNRIALIGDAAHTIHPLAGQGLNMGQSEVATLVEALENGVNRGLDIGSPLVLEPYTLNQWPANHVLLGVCDKFHKIFSTDWEPLVFLRGFGMKSMNMLDYAKDMIMKNISGR